MPLSRYAPPARSWVASARQAAAAAPRSRSRAGAGHRNAVATSATPAAIPHPASRSGTADAGAASDTGKMNASSSAVVAPASTELTTPAKITPNPTTAIATAASHAVCEASVARQTNTPPVTASAASAWSRSAIGPPKSTRSSIAKDPNAANVANCGLPMTLSPSANMAGMMIAARVARRSAAKSQSRWPNHRRGCTWASNGRTAVSVVVVTLLSFYRAGRLLGRGEERLAPFRDVGRECGADAGAGVTYRVDDPGRDGQGLAGVVHLGGLAVDLIFQRACQDVDDFLTRMGVPDRGRVRLHVDAGTDSLASGDGKVVALQAGAPQSRRDLDRRARDVGVLLGGAHLGLPEGGVRNDATIPARGVAPGTSLAGDPGPHVPGPPYTGR